MKKYLVSYLAPALFVFSMSAHAQLKPLLDVIRSTDLNDYALGVSVSTSETGYLGSDTHNFLYPYLTTFTNVAFNDNRIIFAEGELGWRYVTQSQWTFGLMGRLEMRSLEASKDLPGINERKATVELAPAVSYRAWPIHIGFKSYFELLDRHEGSRSRLELSYPKEFSRGFIIPSIELHYNSDDYNRYYYGVDADEASLLLPQYESEAGLNPGFQVKLGYALSERWLLSGGVSFEMLADAISDSPLMDDDRLWSANLGVSYNADIFNPRSLEFTDDNLVKSEIRLSVFSDNIDTQLTNNGSDGAIGNEIDIEDLLGISDKETVLQFDTIFRVSNYHRFELSYFDIDRSGQETLVEDLQFGDELFLAGTTLHSSLETETLRFTYGYSVLLTAQAEVGVKAGIHRTSIESEFISLDTDQMVVNDVSPLLPVLGAFGSLNLGPRMKLVADAQAFGMDFNNYDGNIISLRGELQYNFDFVSVGVGYSFYDMNLRSNKDNLSGRVEFRHQGPSASLAFRF